MGIASRWGRARTAVVASGALASGLMLALGAAPAGASTTPHATSVSYTCGDSITSTKFTSPISITATPTKTVAPGKTTSLTGFQVSVTIPESVVSEAESFGITWVDGTIKTFDINATDAKTAAVNAAGKGITLPKTTLPKPAKAVSMKVPAKAITVGTWTAKAKGTMTYSSGNLDFTLNDSLGVAVTVTCTAAKNTIGKTTVS